MGLLDRLSPRKAYKQPSDNGRLDRRPGRFDPFLGDAELRGAYRALTEGDWPRLEQFLDRSTKRWMFSLAITSELVGLETITFARWVEFERSPQARVHLAGAQVRDAFERRAGGESRNSIDSFRNRLEDAEDILYNVIAERPAMAEPWVFLLQSGRGLGAELEQTRQRFDNAHSREPFRPDACHHYVLSLSERYGGSPAAVFDLARWLEREAPPASAARVALPMAHIEQGLAEEGEAGLARYLIRPDVVAELTTGLTGFLRAMPAPAPVEALGVLNAYALAVSADSPTTAPLVIETLARIDNRPTEYPWSLYREDIVEVFNEIQADQLRFASRH